MAAFRRGDTVCTRRGPTRPVGGLIAARRLRCRATAAQTAWLAILGTACASPAPTRSPAPAGGTAPASEIRITFLHLNDVYEIRPTGDGSVGGPARVATVRSRLLESSPNTFTVLGGDALSPSALGTARVDGERLEGRQMVAVLNTLGLDYATFGNHEFDLGAAAFDNRLRESSFTWVSVNVRSSGQEPLPNVVDHVILRVPGEDGDTVRLALFGVTMDRDQNEYVRIAEPLAAAVRSARLLRDSAEILIALTHLPLRQDVALAQAAPEIDLIMGGHEHENIELRRGPRLTPITKADANTRSVYVHELRWNTRTRSLRTTSTLVPITDTIPADPATRAVADEWVRRGFEGFRRSGFEPETVVANVTVPLDGLESSVLADTTTLAVIIAESMLSEVAGADAAIYNAGSIRIDDVLQPGPVSQYDVIRILPFGGPVLEVEMSGALLRRVLEQGNRNRGTGGFLQRANIEESPGGGWSVGGADLDDARSYRVAVSDYLMSGREQGFDWLDRENSELRVIRELRDVRNAFIDELARRYPASGREPGAGPAVTSLIRPAASDNLGR